MIPEAAACAFELRAILADVAEQITGVDPDLLERASDRRTQRLRKTVGTPLVG